MAITAQQALDELKDNPAADDTPANRNNSAARVGILHTPPHKQQEAA